MTKISGGSNMIYCDNSFAQRFQGKKSDTNPIDMVRIGIATPLQPIDSESFNWDFNWDDILPSAIYM